MSETMSAAEEVKISMKVLINKEKHKVIFAEVDGNFVDILISFLTLPLGTMVRLLVKKYGDGEPVIGSLNTLYKGLADLDIKKFWTRTGKLMLLNPKNRFEDHLRKLKINIDDTEPTRYYICENWSCTRGGNLVNVSIYQDKAKCFCGRPLNNEITLSSNDSIEVGSGVFTSETASFIISDDLQVFPNLVGSGLQILNNLGVNGMDGVEEKTVIVELEEILALLKGSLFSRTPLTDLIFHKTNMATDTVKFEPGSVIGGSAATTCTSKKMAVKAFVQKSTGKVLLAQTREDFVDFVLSMLAIPLGGALSLLGGDSFLGSVHNLYRSLASLNGDWYLKTQNPLNKPQLPRKYVSKYLVFPLTEQTNPLSCITNYNGCYSGHLCHNRTPYLQNEKVHSVEFLDPKGQGSYVKGPAMFMVTDDLVVTPTSAVSGLYILNNLRIPLSDIEEYVIDIGLEEALSILKASLSSASALTDGLKPFLMRQPKQEE